MVIRKPRGNSTFCTTWPQ